MFEVGKSYFFRSVTYHVVGRVEEIRDGWIRLSGASWVAHCGRLMNALREGFEAQSNSEIEPTGDHILSVGAIVDAMPYRHDLPTAQK